MTSVLRSMLPGSSSQGRDHDDEYSVEYSFAIEYSGLPVSYDIPQLTPVDVRQIPTAAVASRAVMLGNLAIPVIQPIPKKSENMNKKMADKVNSGSPVVNSQVPVSNRRKSGRIYSRKPEDFTTREGAAERNGSASHAFDESSSSSGTLGFSDGRGDSNRFSGSSDIEDLDDDNKANVSYGDSSDPNSLNSKRWEIECVEEVSGQGNRTAVVTFRDLPSSDSTSEESVCEDPQMLLERPVVLDDGKKRMCHRCKKGSRFAEREVCIVCNAKYCSKCILRAMGSMPEGRKCISCIRYPIYEPKRGSLGKCSRMLKRLLTDDQVKQIMSAEISCEVNQLPPHLIVVNEEPMSMDELVMLQSCSNPPKKLRPGRYWYDKVSGFWGKEGEKPCQIISPQLPVRSQICQNASNGHTGVRINGREITTEELFMLWIAGIHYEGNPHFWVTPDGSYQHEGMNYVMGKLWEKPRVRMLCFALSLPFPSGTTSLGDNEVKNNKKGTVNMMSKLLLVGSDQSGTSTIFKQAKILYKIPFSEDEKQNIKILIQRNIYRYIGILLEGRARFKEDHDREIRRQRAYEPGPSGKVTSDQIDEENPFSFSPRLENFSNWLLQIMMSGNLEAIFPAATREYSPLVEELWKDKAFQAIYRRRNELPMLPRVANYFLDRAVEVSRMDYEPSEMDILYSEGVTSSNGIASMEFSLPKSSQDGYMESAEQNEQPVSYQLIRVHPNNLGENCKWLEMFEDVDLVLYCVSLTAYAEYYEDKDGNLKNKMLDSVELFEKIITHPAVVKKHFLLVLNKFDLLEEMIERVPLSQCELFHDFNPVVSQHPHNPNSNNNPSMAQRAFHYLGLKFVRLFSSLTHDRKLFVSRATGLEADSVDKALRYGKEILKWADERVTVTMEDLSSESILTSTSNYNS